MSELSSPPITLADRRTGHRCCECALLAAWVRARRVRSILLLSLWLKGIIATRKGMRNLLRSNHAPYYNDLNVQFKKVQQTRVQASDGSDRGSVRSGIKCDLADWIWIAFRFQICPEWSSFGGPPIRSLVSVRSNSYLTPNSLSAFKSHEFSV
jgi:hypothetical protein